MEQGVSPYRSVLYLPGSRERVLEKAKTLPADALILDLEDAVTPSEKPAARELVARAVKAGGFGPRKVLTRINGLDTEWGGEDLVAMCAAGPDAILIPKVETAAMIVEVAGIMAASGAPENTRIWAMMETPRGVLNALEIAGADPLLEGFVMGTNDLAKELGAAQTPDRQPLMTGLGLCLLAARAEGLVCVDGVYNAFKDDEGLEVVCIQGLEMGFDGKTLIHPAQIEITNRVFAPSEEDLALAREQIQAHEEAEARGEGVAVVNGRIVENLHVETARKLLGQADAIARLSESSDAV
ncbi:HpcH/HpaI aldolase/citrate lyase family protein [Amaricoccus tamworthensis]|uniref:HpcH/HpaI aldolase/citrate lyase family protein n=1 Tax=Amaricoccus tamworthensis TaxID=57002 RepID=UPI003C7D7930